MKTLDIESVRWGLLLSFFALFMGVYLGLHFGKNEVEIKKYLEEKAASSSYYNSEDRKPSDGKDAGWKYLKRSHEHFQGLGGISIGLMLLLSVSWLKQPIKTLLSIGIGLGTLIYPFFWYLVAYRAAEIGKYAAKESLALMAQFGAGLYFISFFALFLAFAVFAIWKDNLPAFLTPFKE